MKNQNVEVQKRATYSQSELLDFYKNYGSSKKKKAEFEEQTSLTGSTVEVPIVEHVKIEDPTSITVSTGEDALVEKSQAYAHLLHEIQIANEDLIDKHRKFKYAKARVSSLEEELVKLGKEMREIAGDDLPSCVTFKEWDVSEKSENNNVSNLGFAKFLAEDKKNFEEFESNYSRK